MFVLPDFITLGEDLDEFRPIKGIKWRKAIDFNSKIVKVIAIFGEQWPHTSYSLPGGVVTDPTQTYPYTYPEEVKEEYGIELLKDIEGKAPYDAIIVAVKHKPFIEELDFRKYKQLMKNGHKPVLIDIKGI